MASTTLDTPPDNQDLSLSAYKVSLDELARSELHIETQERLVEFKYLLEIYEDELYADDTYHQEYGNLIIAYNNIIDAYHSIIPSSESLGIGHITTDLLRAIITLIQQQLSALGFTFELEPHVDVLEA